MTSASSPQAKTCSCAEVAGEDPRCFRHGRGTLWRKENPDICAMTDALHEAIHSPQGVIPESVMEFYSERIGKLFAPMTTAAPESAFGDYRERLTKWASRHSDVTPLDGTDRDSPTFGHLRQLLAAAPSDVGGAREAPGLEAAFARYVSEDGWAENAEHADGIAAELMQMVRSYQSAARLSPSGEARNECICPKCGLRHGGGSTVEGGF